MRRTIALAALLAQLASIAHAAVVVHVTCAEHGDLVHASTATAPAGAPARGQAARLVAGATPDEHDRCLLDEDGDAACSEDTSAVSAPPPDPRQPPPFAGRAPLRERRAPLYRLAPKNSPPA